MCFESWFISLKIVSNPEAEVRTRNIESLGVGEFENVCTLFWFNLSKWKKGKREDCINHIKKNKKGKESLYHIQKYLFTMEDEE